MIATSVVIGNVLYVVGAIVLAVIGGSIVALRHRKPKSVEANMASFNRGLRALAPESRPVAGSPVAGSRGQLQSPPERRPHVGMPSVRVAERVRPQDAARDREAEAG